MKFVITASALFAALVLGNPISDPQVPRDTTAVAEGGVDELFARATPECSGSHLAPNNDCWTLLANIRYDTTGVQESPRHIQYNNCYISWSKVVPAHTQRRHLWSAGNEVMGWCRDAYKPGEVSGLKRWVKVNDGAEMTVCISDRKSGCS